MEILDPWSQTSGARGDGAPATVGVSGHGFKHAPVIGEIVAALMCDGRSRTWDITPFSSHRFTDGRPRGEASTNTGRIGV